MKETKIGRCYQEQNKRIQYTGSLDLIRNRDPFLSAAKVEKDQPVLMHLHNATLLDGGQHITSFQGGGTKIEVHLVGDFF